MHNWMLKLFIAMVLTMSLFAPSAHAEPIDPAAVPIQSFYATLLDCMKGGKTLGAQGRYDKLKPVVEQTFELGLMIKYAVGPTWNAISGEEQGALSTAFARMTIAQYAGNFSSFDGEKFVVQPKADIRGADHYVKTSLVAKDQTVQFIYRMRQFGNDWKIIDILLDGSISQLSVYRSDFAATLRAGGPSALVKKINAVADKALKS